MHNFKVYVSYVYDVQYDGVALNRVVVCFSTSLFFYVATQSGLIFLFTSLMLSHFLSCSSFQPHVQTCGKSVTKRKRSKQQLPCPVCTERCMSQSAWLHQRLSSALALLLATSQENWNCLPSCFFFFFKSLGDKKHRLQPQQERSTVCRIWL